MNMNDIKKVKNLVEMGLENARILGFLNNAGYSDCHSWLLVKEGDVLVGYEVERDFKPKFDGHYCYNNEEQRYAPIVLNGGKVEVTHRKVKGMSQFGNWVVETWCGEPLKTPTGRLKKRWVGMGELRNYCCQFHDYNF